MEVLMENLVEQELVSLDNVQLKTEHKIQLPENAKKVISVNSQLLGQNAQVAGNEVALTGNFVTRLVFINEFDKFDSQNFTETFEKKITVKDTGNSSQIWAIATLIDSQWQVQDNQVVLENFVDVNVQGVRARDVQVVSDLTGDVEVRKAEHQILTFSTLVQDKFEVNENIVLDPACEGVLGVDVNPNLKEINTTDGKVNLKGALVVTVLGIKTVDNVSVPYNAEQEINFSKSIIVNGVTDEDLAIGSVVVHSVEMHIENTQQGAVLVLKVELAFNGYVYENHKFNTVVDAISFDKELTLETTPMNYVEVLPQVSTTVDIENNINLAPNTPYITHVLAVDCAHINQVKVNATDGKILLEGVLAMNLLLENEEHVITGEYYEVPFQTHVRMDNLDRDYVVNASVLPLHVNVKARRGTELLIDAQLGVLIQASTQKQITVVNDLKEGADKVDDGSAIRIYIIGEKENLWNLAKRTNLSSAALLQQNPNLENGCTPGERIVVYRHENVNL
ncbi:MAG: DUF3794 domain-containing protein [Clostridia bacterium]|nr:DUF3794 domain-containing protein [Clostridia bacterium]